MSAPVEPAYDVFSKWLSETFDNPEIMYVTFERSGENWSLRRFTRVPRNAGNPLFDPPFNP